MHFCDREHVSRGARHGKNPCHLKNVKLSIFFPLYAFRVKKRDINWVFLTHIFPLICVSGEKTWHKLGKNDHLDREWNCPHFSPYMQNSPKNVTKMCKNCPLFFPYMQNCPKLLTKIRKIDHLHKIVKIVHFFPLYAKRGEIYDTNCPKLTDIFPLYAFWVENCDQNCMFWADINLPILTHLFPLICKFGWKMLPKWPKNVHNHDLKHLEMPPTPII